MCNKTSIISIQRYYYIYGISIKLVKKSGYAVKNSHIIVADE